MLTANQLPRTFGKDVQFEVLVAGSAIGTINDTKSSFDLQGQTFTMTAKGLLGPSRELRCGETLIATAVQKALVNDHSLTFGAKEWAFKATSLLATKFGLFQNDKQTGEVSAGSYFNRLKNITANLPEELPREVQIFLLAIFISQLTAE